MLPGHQLFFPGSTYKNSTPTSMNTRQHKAHTSDPKPRAPHTEPSQPQRKSTPTATVDDNDSNNKPRKLNKMTYKGNRTLFPPERKALKIKQTKQNRLNKTKQDPWEGSHQDSNKTNRHTAIHQKTRRLLSKESVSELSSCSCSLKSSKNDFQEKEDICPVARAAERS